MTDEQFYARLIQPYAPNLDGPPSGNALEDGVTWDRLTEAERAEVAAFHRNYISEEEVD
jgi:hypothetical protein